jgi:2'-5' RNA ligase
MRLFTAIDLPGEVSGSLDALLEKLRPAARIRWSRVANLHITTKFIGDWPGERLAELSSALRQVRPPGEISISLRGFGWFPNPHQPRVFWIGVHAPESLAALARATDEAAAALGIARETKLYRPHLTLARLDAQKDPPGSARALRSAVASLPSPDAGSFHATGWHLYLSEPGPGGSQYTRLETFSLL